MMSKLVRRNIYVKKSSIQGYGVFAGEDINPDEVIEECLTLSRQSADAVLENYYFQETENGYYLLPLGFGSIYNHSNHPNADHEFDLVNSLMILRSNRLIKKDEEVFIFYGPTWFQERGKKEIERFKYRIRHSLGSFFYFLLRFIIVAGLLLALILLMKH